MLLIIKAKNSILLENQKNFKLLSGLLAFFSFLVVLLVGKIQSALNAKFLGQLGMILLFLSYFPLIILIFTFLFDFIKLSSNETKHYLLVTHNLLFSVCIGLITVHFINLYEKAPLNSISFIGLIAIWLIEQSILINQDRMSNTILQGFFYLLFSSFIFRMSFHAKIWSRVLMMVFSLIFTLIIFKLTIGILIRKVFNDKSINTI